MKSFIAITALLLTASVSQAQFLKLGIKGGANLSRVSGKSFKDEFGLGYFVGGFAEVKIAHNWYINPEVQFGENRARQSSEFKSIYQNLANTDSLKSIKLHYLSIPVLLSYKVSNIFSLQAGPQFGLLIDRHENLLQNGKSAFDDGDLSLLAGVNIHVGKFRVSARYAWGLKSINGIDNKDNWTTQTAQAGIGFVL